jgi:transposase, IS5 family
MNILTGKSFNILLMKHLKMRIKIYRKVGAPQSTNRRTKDQHKEKSRTRARVDHLFGCVENSMNGSFIHTIGITRTKSEDWNDELNV